MPYPNVHLTFSDRAATVTGVSSGFTIKVLEGERGVFGVAFRPGCFRPWLGRSVSTITDRSVDAREIFGAVPTEPDHAAVERFLRARLPAPDAPAFEAAEMVSTIAGTPELTRADAVARLGGMSVRQLQRLFAEYVGIGPKWVIRRYRLREVTARLESGVVIDWATLAADLGYADQAHFTRDFKAMFGESPTAYARRY
ncbi:MAG TPA: helix-turn-helix domain-containing protein [Amycolatopsis sp.]|nr:helix-turn-helix domain-containing protein [Amycolatopsis sp.]